MRDLDYESIIELLDYREQENTHFMPNEIFDDLQTNLSKSPHIAFGYSYYYLISWLYRNAKYGAQHIDVKIIKQLLGYSPTNKTVNYIIKNGGILDEMGYTETTNNYPVFWAMDEFNSPHFDLINDLDSDTQQTIKKEKGKKGNRITVKYPIKHFHADVLDHEDEMLTGVFYDISNTHSIDFEVFIHCMSIEELGTTAFYLYSYLKNKNQLFPMGYDVSVLNLQQNTRLSYGALCDYLDKLKGYRLIDVIHNQDYFSVGIKDEDRKANTYITNDSNRFLFKKLPYRKMETKSHSQHLEIMKRKGQTVEFGDLPFS